MRIKEDSPPSAKREIFKDIEDFEAACKRVRAAIAQRDERKATLVFDVHTKAGYNAEDWKTVTFEAVLDLDVPAPISTAPSAPAPKATPKALEVAPEPSKASK